MSTSRTLGTRGLAASGLETDTGYYPEVVKPEIFHLVQRFRANKGKGGRTGKADNLFVHLVKCAYCGGAMVLVDKGRARGSKHLVCENGRRGTGCEYHAVRYDECENLLLDNCHKLRPEQVLSSPDEQQQLCQLLLQRIEGQEAELSDIAQRQANYLDQIGRTGSANRRDEYEKRIGVLDEQQAKIVQQKSSR